VCRITYHCEAVHGVYSVVITSERVVDGMTITPEMEVSLAVALHVQKDIFGMLRIASHLFFTTYLMSKSGTIMHLVTSI
jgi:hypothetical protein